MENEYKVVQIVTKQSFWGSVEVFGDELESKLNALAKDNWEVVNSYPVTQAYGATTMIIIILRRLQK